MIIACLLQICSIIIAWMQNITKLQMFSFFVTYAEICSECEIDGSILPSIESFQMRLKLPKVNFIFCEYFFKAVVGDGIWKQWFAENKRLGTNVSEAFAHAIIENNYFAWLYDYKKKNPGCPLATNWIWLSWSRKWRFKWQWWQTYLL